MSIITKRVIKVFFMMGTYAKKMLTNLIFFDKIGFESRKNRFSQRKRNIPALLVFVSLVIIISSCSEKIDISQGCLNYGGEKYIKCKKIIEKKAEALTTYKLETIKDITDCNKYKEKITRNNCIKDFALKKAIENRNPDLCEEIDRAFGEEDLNFKGACYSNYAFYTKDPNICLLIKKNDFYSQSQCIMDIAFNTSDVELCNLITAEEPRQLCFNGFRWK